MVGHQGRGERLSRRPALGLFLPLTGSREPPIPRAESSTKLEDNKKKDKSPLQPTGKNKEVTRPLLKVAAFVLSGVPPASYC